MNDAEQEIPIPEQISKYKIEGLLTKGGMSLLYLGTHPDSSEPVLIKVLLPKFLKDKEIVSRFVNEANVIAKANHPNIVRLYDSGTWENGLYIAMEFVKGTSLRKILTHQPFSLKRALEILLQIAYALCHLHTHGIVHGDVKPENILITETGQVKLIDFGIAHVLTEKNRSNAPKRLVGTPIYMSPEQLENWGNVSCQSDIYSLGIIAYELALGKITHGRIILSLAPKGLQKILHKALQPKVEDRYSDMTDFIADLSNYIKSGSYKQDKQGSDYFLELFETLERFQTSITSEQIPALNDIEIGLCLRSGMGLSGQFYSYNDLGQNKRAIFIAESLVKGVEGTLAISAIRMLFLTLKELYKNPKELMQKLYSLIQSDSYIKAIRFAYLVIDTVMHDFEFYNNQYGTLLLDAKNVETLPLIESLVFAKSSYRVGQRLLFAASAISNQNLLHALQTAFQETIEQSCQQQAESIVRRLHLKEVSSFEEEPLLVLAILPK